MHTAKVKKVGGSQMIAVPPALLQTMGIQVGAEVEMTIDGGRLIIELPRKRVRLEDLLAQCYPDLPISEEDAAWAAEGPVGGEMI